MPLPSFSSQAFNFISSTRDSVDTGTGLSNVRLPLVNLHSSTLSGPAPGRIDTQTVSGSDVRQLYDRGDEQVNEVQIQQKQETRPIRAEHTCLDVSCGSGLTLTAGDHHDSLLWSRDTGQKEGQPHSWSPYGSGKPTEGLPGYNGERADPISGAYHLGNGYRAYSPMLMRFTCPDSLSPFGAGGINPYAYCAGDPVNHIDPSGHLSWQGTLGIVAGTLGLAFSVFTAGASIAAAGGVMAALGAASATTLAVGGLGVAADVTGIASGATEESHPQASSVLGWVSMVTGLAGMAEGLVQGARGVMKLKTGGGAVMDSDRAPLRLRGGAPGGDEAHMTHIMDLPEEMIRKIGQNLALDDLNAFRKVSSRFDRAMTERDILRARQDKIRAIESYQMPMHYYESRTVYGLNADTSSHLTPFYERIMRLDNYLALNDIAKSDDAEAMSVNLAIHRDLQRKLFATGNPFSADDVLRNTRQVCGRYREAGIMPACWRI